MENRQIEGLGVTVLEYQRASRVLRRSDTYRLLNANVSSVNRPLVVVERTKLT